MTWEVEAVEEMLRESRRLKLRPYQRSIFEDHSSGVVVLHWSRQIGKSHTLAAWAVWRLITRPGRLVTVLSNSRDNGAEFLRKCAEFCRAFESGCFVSEEKGREARIRDTRMELRVRVWGREGRIKVLAANPRTARGFSGDLILDEFAFHENSTAIWEAAEPILASHPDYLCRIASTGNGRHNMFYRMVQGREGIKNEKLKIKNEGPEGNAEHRTSIRLRQAAARQDTEHRMKDKDAPHTGPLPTTASRGEGGDPAPGCSSRLENAPAAGSSGVAAAETAALRWQYEYVSACGFWVSRVPRSLAYGMGMDIYDLQTRRKTTPQAARAKALDKRAYDQNYECAFADEHLTLLTYELIGAAERNDVGVICERDWSQAALARMRNARESLFVGFDVGRKVDMSVITVLEKIGEIHLVRGMLRMRDMRLPEQELRLGEVCRMPMFRRAAIDMTGLGLGLFEHAQKKFGASRIEGVNFGSVVPATRRESDGEKRQSARVTEVMAMELLRVYEERRIQHPEDELLREDLRKPEKVTSPGGRVCIAATRDEAGHADHFWSLALAVEAGAGPGAQFGFQPLELRSRKPGILL
jgi:phage FluMu gp28-like protein